MQSKRGRIDRFIAKTKVLPLKEAKVAIAQRRVKVDGFVVDDVQHQIDEFSCIEFDQETLQKNSRLYIALHKPKGVVCATKDSQHQTVLDLIHHPMKSDLHIVGRLDLNSTGLVLLTNDSQWSKRINQPDLKLPKRYIVSLRNPIDETYVTAFEQGLYFEKEKRMTQPARLKLISNYEADVVLTEGMYHQIKRMFGRFRNEVLALHRVQVGSFYLPESLAQSDWCELSIQQAKELIGD